MSTDSLTPIPQRPNSAFLRTVSQHKIAPRGPDGGYLVPRHLFGHLLADHAALRKEQRPDEDPPKAGTRVYAIAPLANSSLLADDEFAARALLTSLVDMLCLKVPRWVLRSYPVEMEASAEASYRTPNGKIVSAFEHDQTVFRLTVRMSDSPEEPPANPRLGAEVER